ncbi:MAG: hypothetical protein HZC36_02640 [Armatimonadetes bacterium]|nr:hypothetical protein [Armatimonadota bacterium]
MLMLRRFELERRKQERSGKGIERLPHLTRRTSLDRSWRCVEWTALPDDRADELIETEIRESESLEEGWEWKVYSTDSPRDLRERLRKHGFQIGTQETAMGFDLGRVESLPSGAPGIEIRAIITEDDLAAFRNIAETLFKKDFAYSTGHLRQGIGKKSAIHRGLLALVEGVPAAIGCLYLSKGSHFGYLYCGGTLPEFRGKGAYRAMVAARALLARGLGMRYLLIDAQPTSEPILRRLGFIEIAKTWPCTWPGHRKQGL